MTKRFVRPAPVSAANSTALRRIPDPATGLPLPNDGCEVTWSSYWTRREADGDLLFKPAKIAGTTQNKD